MTRLEATNKATEARDTVGTLLAAAASGALDLTAEEQGELIDARESLRTFDRLMRDAVGEFAL